MTKLLAFSLGRVPRPALRVSSTPRSSRSCHPDQFLFTVSFTVLAMVVLGGMGNIWGVAVGAFIVYNIQAVMLKRINGVIETSDSAFDLGPIP